MLADTTLPCLVLEAANYTDRVVSKGYFCLHSIESPPGKSWAEALGGPAYFQNPATQASVHYIVDGDSVVQTAPETKHTWSTGSPGSKHGIHIEQAGYAAFSRAQWMGDSSAVGSSYTRPSGARVTYTAQDAADMAAQFQLVALLLADICRRHRWGPVAASRTELIRETQGEDLGRHVRHRDITEWVGGTTHTDPGPDYPWPDLLTQIGRLTHSTVTPTAPSTPSIPTAPSTTGGFLMALTEQQQTEMYDTLHDLRSKGVGKGQTSVGGTLAALLNDTQRSYNQLAGIAGTVQKLLAESGVADEIVQRVVTVIRQQAN